MGKVTCFLGHRKVPDSPYLRSKIETLVVDLIENNEVDTFLFGSRSEFDDICWEIVTRLKESYSHIKRIQYRHNYPEIPDWYCNYFFENYEDNIFPDKALHAGSSVYIERNQAMIDDSDFCIFYYDENFLPSPKKRSKKFVSLVQPKSGTAQSFCYAITKKKKIFNVFQKE